MVLLGLAVVSCAAPAPAEPVVVPDVLRSCLHPAAVPAPVPKIIGPATLRAAYEVEVATRQKDQAAAVDCGKKLAAVIELTDEFNVLHAH